MDTPKGWTLENDTLVRTYTLKSFVQAVEFVNNIIPYAESAQHHPDIDIFSYCNVRVKLTTHDDGAKVTQKDIDLAIKLNNKLRIPHD
jgi:4a-hydroxytetrahydrobiopterin dehydratase